MIVITVFATRTEIVAPEVPDPYTRRDIMLNTKTGLAILIYTWVAGFIWPYVLLRIIGGDVIDNHTIELKTTVDASSNWSTSRDLIGFISTRRFNEVQQLLRFGYIVKKDYVSDRVKYPVYFCFVSLLYNEYCIIRV